MYMALPSRPKAMASPISIRAGCREPPDRLPCPLAVDAERPEVIGAELSAHCVGDGEVLPEPLNQTDPVESLGKISGDGAYDTRACQEAILKRDAQALISPREGAVAWPALPGPAGKMGRSSCRDRTSVFLILGDVDHGGLLL
jgi:hypothetical protein